MLKAGCSTQGHFLYLACHIDRDKKIKEQPLEQTINDDELPVTISGDDHTKTARA